MSELDKARAEAALARKRVLATAHEVQGRLKPKRIAEDAVEGVKRKSESIAGDAVEAVKSRPVVAGAAAASVAALLGVGIFSRFRHKSEKDER
ncbi:hypothetical protein [Sphingomonas bacterium]|uniref:hypothetical protein n=1 Tax=Sphingomonas bacterium TaxID=1895847 RepID=UPI001577233D|nr:hypothetical protein [Sphingomonas bacterium]